MTNHESRKQQILAEAEERGLSRKDLNVLTTDPYLVGTEGEYRDAQWAADFWDKMMTTRKQPLHIRGFYYWLYNNVRKPDGKKFGSGADDPMKDWRWLMRATQVARYLGIGEWKGLVDMKHPDVCDYDRYIDDIGLFMSQGTVHENVSDDITSMVDDLMARAKRLVPEYRDDGYQTYHIEVWCEKNSMGFIIDPVCRRMGASYQPLIGQASVEKVEMLAKRVVRAAEAGKKVRIWYIADWDRYGWSMVTAVARKLEFMLIDRGAEVDVKLTRLALNEDQINKYKLPKAPKKGEAVVELDALEAIHPGELGKIIKEAVTQYLDTKSPIIIREENRRMVDRFSSILEEKLRPVLEEALHNIEIPDLGIDMNNCIDKGFEMPERGHKVDEDDSWVYDSNRDWFDQLERFKEYKESREE